MNAVEAANKAEVDMIHAALNKKYGRLYADIWKVGVNVCHCALVTCLL
jgi:hypothetical protein